jgi:hypothetical protein
MVSEDDNGRDVLWYRWCGVNVRVSWRCLQKSTLLANDGSKATLLEVGPSQVHPILEPKHGPWMCSYPWHPKTWVVNHRGAPGEACTVRSMGKRRIIHGVEQIKKSKIASILLDNS